MHVYDDFKRSSMYVLQTVVILARMNHRVGLQLNLKNASSCPICMRSIGASSGILVSFTKHPDKLAHGLEESPLTDRQTNSMLMMDAH